MIFQLTLVLLCILPALHCRYPLKSPNRRLERRQDIVDYIQTIKPFDRVVDFSEYVVCPFYSLPPSLSLPLFALRSEKTRRLSIDVTK